jgi:uncharacterized damage-inducible protein DinB
MLVPYAEHVGDRNPVELLTTTLEEYRDAAALLAEASWNQPWAAGKWTMRQVMVHVAQWEMIFGYRVMCAIASPGFTIQMADQDALLTHTGAVDGATAFAAFDGSRRLNIGVIQSLSAAERATCVTHPEYGTLTVNDLITQMAGHGMHHLKQIREALGPKAGIVD